MPFVSLGRLVADLTGQLVAVSRSDTKDTYYGHLESIEGDIITLTDAKWGWHGEAGWWGHGRAETLCFPWHHVRAIVRAGSYP